MAEVPSTFQLERGEKAPAFSLPDGHGKAHSLADLSAGAEAVLIAFVCNHCPFVVHLADAFGQFAREYRDRGLAVVAVSSNDVENYPQDSPQNMLRFAEQHGWTFPYLYDESQEVALAYAAACTPDFYLFDRNLCLAYAGQFDSTRPGRSGDGISGEDLRRAVDLLLEDGEGPAPPWQPSSGCNIKWKADRVPDYFSQRSRA